MVKKWRSLLGDDHLDTLVGTRNLGPSYSILGREEEAVALREEVVEKRRRLIGDDHLNTPGAISNLAASYPKVGRGK